MRWQRNRQGRGANASRGENTTFKALESVLPPFRNIRGRGPAPNRRSGQRFRKAGHTKRTHRKRKIVPTGSGCCYRGHAQMSRSLPSGRPGSRPARCLVFLTALGIVMYFCMGTFRFTHDGLNLAFGCLFLLLPFFAIKPALRMPRRAKITTLVLLMPMLAFSVLGMSAMAAFDIPDAVNHVQLSRELCTLQHGDYSVHLAWEETAGGAIGPHGVSLEQRRGIFPGLYLVKSLDYFEGASEGTLSWAGADRVS